MASASDPHVDHVPGGAPAPTAPGRAAGATGATATALALVLALVYAATFGSWSDGQLVGNDAVHYAAAVAAGDTDALLLANHLLPHLLARGVYALGDALGALEPGLAGALVAQRLLSAIGGGLAVALVWRLVRAATGTRSAAALAAGVLATSSGLWLYASVGETYAPAAAAEAWVLFELWRARTRGGWRRLAAALVVATLVRQDAVLVAVAVPIVLGRRALVPLAVGGAISLLSFLAAFAPLGRDAVFGEWLVGIGGTDTWGVGAARASAWLAATVHGVLTLDAFAFGAHRTDGWPSARLLAYAALALHAAGLVVAFAPRARGSRADTRHAAHGDRTRLAAGLAAFVLVRFAFHAWFQPSNIEYAVGHLAPLVLLAALVWSRAPRGPSLIAWSGLAVQFVATLLLIVPLRDARLDGDVRALTELARARGQALMVVTVEPFGELAIAREHYRCGDPRDPRARTAPDDRSLFRVDGSDGHAPERAREIAALVGAELARGRDVAVVVDRRLAHVLGLPRTQVPAPLAQALVDLVDFEELDTSSALAAYLLPAADREERP